jgi:hypothetical protein
VLARVGLLAGQVGDRGGGGGHDAARCYRGRERQGGFVKNFTSGVEAGEGWPARYAKGRERGNAETLSFKTRMGANGPRIKIAKGARETREMTRSGVEAEWGWSS